MALQAKEDFPSIDFTKSIMVGDSMTDMMFGKNIGAFNIYISKEKTSINESSIQIIIDSLDSLCHLYFS